MINFIIYEDNLKWQNYYKSIIFKVIDTRRESYQIITISRFESDTIAKINAISGKKIFLLDLEVPGKSGLDLARIIRKENDWLSPIIIVTSHESYKNEGFTSKILMLDFIVKNKDIGKLLNETIGIALKIHTTYESFNFYYNNEYYQIPHENILFFEKDLNNNYTLINTENEQFRIKESITKIHKILEEYPHFYKTHRSCIVNVNNIKKVDFTKNYIYFENNYTNLLARDKKKELKGKLLREL